MDFVIYIQFSGGLDFTGEFCEISLLEDWTSLVNFVVQVFWRNVFLWWVS